MENPLIYRETTGNIHYIEMGVHQVLMELMSFCRERNRNVEIEKEINPYRQNGKYYNNLRNSLCCCPYMLQVRAILDNHQYFYHLIALPYIISYYHLQFCHRDGS